MLVVSGLPGSGKSTLINRAVAAAGRGGGTVRRVDSQDVREQWERVLPSWLPYAVYRPLVRAVHYVRLGRALRLSAGAVVHDCGSQAWVRRWAAHAAGRRDRALRMVLLDVPPEEALAGQAARGRGVSRRAFARHRRAIGRLVAEARDGRMPRGCASMLLLDREAASRLGAITFGRGPVRLIDRPAPPHHDRPVPRPRRYR